MPVVRDTAIAMMMDLIRDDLAAFSVRQEVFTSERSLHGQDGSKVREILDELQDRGLVYSGRLEPPKSIS